MKLLLLSPLILLILYGAVLRPTSGVNEISGGARSFLPLGALGLCLMSMTQLSHNLFGFDRSGFRAYVLSGVPRSEILIGKNLALAPLLLVLVLPMLIILQFLTPAPGTHFLALLLEIPTAFLLVSLLGNLCSVLCPVCQAAGSLKPAEFKVLPMLLQFLSALATLVVLGLVAALPLGLELLLQSVGMVPAALPLAFLIAVCELAGTVPFYRFIVGWQGTLLQSRECRILEVVTEKDQ